MPRLYHTKSKYGCSRCRSRRVKCDETRPVCGDCSRHSVECVYDRKAEPQSRHASQARSQDSASPSSKTPESNTTNGIIGAETAARRLTELQLLHYFTAEVSPTMPGNYIKIVRQTWRVNVPRLALRYRPLLNAMMAISILHMSATGFVAQPPIEDAQTQRARYLEATLQGHREAIGSYDKTIADGAAVTSLVLALDALANLRGRPLEPYEAPSPWLRMCKGVMNLFRIGREVLRDEENAAINQIINSGSKITDPATIFCEANRSRFPTLLVRQSSETDTDDEAYVTTISYIGAIVNAKESGADTMAVTTRRIISYPVMFPKRFAELLGKHEPRALAILAHYFAAARGSELSPWIGDTPRREILAISTYLSKEWHHLLQWPLETLDHPTPPY